MPAELHEAIARLAMLLSAAEGQRVTNEQAMARAAQAGIAVLEREAHEKLATLSRELQDAPQAPIHSEEARGIVNSGPPPAESRRCPHGRPSPRACAQCQTTEQRR
jgi:hypothetical protein